MKCNPNSFGVRVAKTCGDELAKLGITGNCIGCGEFGCIFPAGRNRVAKITDTIEEYSAAKWVKQNPHFMLPKIYSIRKLSKECMSLVDPHVALEPEDTLEPEEGYVIIREDLADVKVDDFNTVDNALMHLSHSFVGETKAVRDDDRRMFQDEFDRLTSKKDQAILLEMRAFADWALSKGIAALDLDVENIGQRRNGDIVIRDFGAFYPLAEARSGRLSTIW